MRIYNSLSQSLQEFKPLEKKRIRMYVCGITPYDTTHLGHAFLYVFFDVVLRYFTLKGYKVTYVQNVTDIDDDILKRAKEEKRDWKELGEFWTNRFLKDLSFLNILLPTYYVKATESIPTMIRIIRVLIDKNLAYEKNGNVYFDVSSFKEYGKLCRMNEKQMLLISKDRGNNPNDPLKKHPLDFVLWQKSLINEPYWQSPWSRGRPGWHIECSAMINDYLGEQIDIHGGGEDLIFPHHESEIAQSESFFGKSPFVAYWMHTSMLAYQGEKMSKSLDNLILVTDLAKQYSASAIRYLLLSHHYRMPWEYQKTELDESEKKVNAIANAIKNVDKKVEADTGLLSRFYSLMENDFAVPTVIAFMHSVVDSMKNQLEDNKKDKMIKALYTMHTTLGFTL